MIAAGIRSLDISFLDGNMFSKVTISWTSDIFINFVIFLHVMEWNPYITRFLIVRMDRLISPMCSFAAHVCRYAGDKNSQRGSN